MEDTLSWLHPVFLRPWNYLCCFEQVTASLMWVRIGEKELCLKWPFYVWMFLTAYSSSWLPANIQCVNLLLTRKYCLWFVGAAGALWCCGWVLRLLCQWRSCAGSGWGQLWCLRWHLRDPDTWGAISKRAGQPSQPASGVFRSVWGCAQLLKRAGRGLLLRWLLRRPLPMGWWLASSCASPGGVWFVSSSLFPSPDKTSLSEPMSSFVLILYVLSCPAGGWWGSRGETCEVRQAGETLMDGQ